MAHFGCMVYERKRLGSTENIGSTENNVFIVYVPTYLGSQPPS